MILVVFGAGASYDSLPSRPPSKYGRAALANRPPLAAELFLHNEDVLVRNLRRFPQCYPIVPYLQGDSTDTIERRLQILQIESTDDLERKRQLAAIRYYLHMALWECEEAWSLNVAHGITNYVTLLDQLRRSRRNDEPVLLVTFNYDRMIERALESVNIPMNVLQHYISNGAFKLFKVHGSAHWAREVDTTIPNIGGLNDWEVVSELIRLAPELTISDRYRLIADVHPISRADEIPLFPAIAIPVETKSAFECPSEHLECLRDLLKGVTRILLIGWQATEEHFLTMLEQSLPKNLPIQVVAGRRDWAEEILGKVRRLGISETPSGGAFGGGFTEYILSRQAEEFLRTR
jgi:hypothetical protein